MLDTKREIQEYLDSIFVLIPPKKEYLELYYEKLGAYHQRQEALEQGGASSVAALETVLEEISQDEAIHQVLFSQDGSVWNKDEQEIRRRKRGQILLISLVLFVLGFLVLVLGLLLGRSVSPWVWIGITILFWLFPVVLLLVQRQAYGDLENIETFHYPEQFPSEEEK